MNFYSGIEPHISFSIDNLTILGNFRDITNYDNLLKRFNFFLLNDDECRLIRNDNMFFTFSFMLHNSLFIQLDRVTNKCRMEINPNKITPKGRNELNYILKFLREIHFTRIDLAIDLYNYKLSTYNIVDVGNRKKSYFYNRIGELETLYSGSYKSSKFIRIYNKAVEQKLPNMDWWRFEIQLRDVYIDKYLQDLLSFYDDIFIFKYNIMDKYDITTNAMVEYLLRDINRINLLSKNVKPKYKKIIKNLEIYSIEFLNDIISITTQKVNDYLMYLCDNLSLPDSLVFNEDPLFNDS